MGGYSRFSEPYRADHMMEREQRQRRTLIIGASVTGVSLLGMLIAALLVWDWAFHDLPPAPASASELWSVRLEPSVTVLDTHGDVLAVRGPLYARAISLEALPAYVPQAFLAIEDQRFYQHGGVDYRGVARAATPDTPATPRHTPPPPPPTPPSPNPHSDPATDTTPPPR